MNRRAVFTRDANELARLRFTWIEALGTDKRMDNCGGRIVVSSDVHIGVVIVTKYLNRRDGFAFPSHQRLARDTGYCVKTIHNSTHRLESAGYFRIQRGRPNKYWITIPESCCRLESGNSLHKSTQSTTCNEQLRAINSANAFLDIGNGLPPNLDSKPVEEPAAAASAGFPAAAEAAAVEKTRWWEQSEAWSKIVEETSDPLLPIYLGMTRLGSSGTDIICKYPRVLEFMRRWKSQIEERLGCSLALALEDETDGGA
jgi:hypothetical protein